MTSDTDIVNKALGDIGGTKISSLTDGTTNANHALCIYEPLRDALLDEAHWKFAKKKVKLARHGTAPAFGFDYAYALPSDWVHTIEIFDNDAGVGFVDYEEGEVSGISVIESSAEDIYLTYVYKVTDPNRFSQLFRMALEVAISRDLCVAVQGSGTLRDRLVEDAKTALRKAKSRDTLAEPVRQRPRGSWAQSRNAWPSTRWPR